LERRREIALKLAAITPQAARANAIDPIALRYRGIDASTGQMSDWMPRWDDTRRLPMLVEIQIVPAKGAPWPTLVVAPRAGGSGGAR